MKGLKLSINPYSLNKLGNIHMLIPKLEKSKNIPSLIPINPTRKISKYKLINHTAYFTANGQTGNNTKDNITRISKMNFQFVLYVVS